VLPALPICLTFEHVFILHRIFASAKNIDSQLFQIYFLFLLLIL